MTTHSRFHRVLTTTAALLVLACLGLMSRPAEAAVLSLTISDHNASATIEPTSGRGMLDWTVDGYQHLEQQWFWYRVGQDKEHNLSDLDLVGYRLIDTNWDDANDLLALKYSDPGGKFEIELRLVMTGGSPGTGLSDIAETISIKSTSDQPLDFHFFQYCDLNLMGTETDQSVEITNGNSATQLDMSASVSETVETPPANHFQAGIGSETLDMLTNDDPNTLGDVAGPLGPGDLTWAFEWDFTLGPEGSSTDSFLISKDKYVTPEPAALSLLAAGALALTLRRRRK